MNKWEFFPLAWSVHLWRTEMDGLSYQEQK